jgi:hypothetical protein
MLLILGETLATGRYAFHGGLTGAEDEDDLNPSDNESMIDPNLRPSATGSATTSTPSTRPQTPLSTTTRPSTSDSNNTGETTESQAQKRHRESASLQPPSTSKKPKVSGVGMMDKMSESLSSVAEALKASDQPAKETVDSTIAGQAQQQVQDENCLTEEGQLVLLDMLSDASLARTFMAIKAEKLRTKWLKKQLEKYVESTGIDLGELFIDWEDTQH